MCDRYYLLTPPAELADLFHLADVPDVAPRYNIAPSQQVLAVGLDKAGLPAVASFRWGMIPRWAADAKLAPINARSETAEKRGVLRFRARHCLQLHHPLDVRIAPGPSAVEKARRLFAVRVGVVVDGEEE